MKEQPNMKTEKPKIKEKRLKYEAELEQRPEPLDEETLDAWIKRIGGPNVRLVESLKEYKAPKSKEKAPLIINRNGNFVLNSENVGTYFNKEKLDAELEKKNPSIRFIKKIGEYRLKKELFKKPELYFQVIGEELKEKRKIVADKKFGKSLDKWIVAAESKKEPTLEEKIVQKEKELEDAKQKYNIYYSPVVQDMMGLYYKKQVEDLTHELKELKKRYKKKEEKAEEKKEESVKTDAVGGGIRIGESAEDIENRLQELSAEIQTSSVLGRSKLEKEQKKLKKRLKKLKKK
jgi:hypothetical protein